MSKEILAIPEENLQEVITVMRVGLDSNRIMGNPDVVSYETRRMLVKWCDDMESYMIEQWNKNELG